MLEKPKEVLADIGDITVDNQQPFEKYMKDSIVATLEWAKKKTILKILSVWNQI